MIGEAGDCFEPGEAVPAELLLEPGELIDPAAVEAVPVVARGDAAESAEQFTFNNGRSDVFDHGWKDSAKAVVSAGEMAQQRSPVFGNAIEEAGVCSKQIERTKLVAPSVWQVARFPSFPDFRAG